MHAETARREERPFEVRAEVPRADLAGGNLAQRCDELLLGRRHERRLKRRDSRREHRLACATVRGSVGRGEVDAAEAVDVEVDEAGYRDARTASTHADARDPRALDLDVARDEPAVDERRLDAEPHSVRSAGYSRRKRS